MAQKPSIYDIAELAGISAGSVSKILNGKGSFSQKTRERVLRIAHEQGYVANFAAKALRKASTHSVGVITPDVSNEFFSSIVLAAEIELRMHGYTSYICNTGGDLEVEAECLHGFMQRQTDGFLFVGGKYPVSRETVGEQTPLVSVDRPGCGGDWCVEVQNDLFAMGYDATQVLLRHGCEHIAFLNVFHGTTHKGDPRFEGYGQALAEADMVVDERLVLDGRPHERSYVGAERLIDGCLDAGLPLDGVVAVGDRVAIGAVNSLRKHGVKLGEVRVIGMDNSSYSLMGSPTLSTIDRRTDVLAQDAALALLGMLGGEQAAGSTIVVPHQIIERETTLGGALDTAGAREPVLVHQGGNGNNL